MKKTYLLGAGFSKAFHQSMPLMNELAGEVLLELGLDAEVLSPFRDDLEAWLSYIATRQPWEDDVTAAQNEATFLQASAAIATCITRASGRPAPHGDRGQQ